MPMKLARDRQAEILEKLRRAGARALVSEQEFLQPSAEMAGRMRWLLRRREYRGQFDRDGLEGRQSRLSLISHDSL